MPQRLLAMFGLPGGTELIVIGVFGLLLFGRRLPDVARSMGKSIVEFKKGLKDVKEEIDSASSNENRILPNDAPKTDTTHPAVSSDQPAQQSKSD